MSTAFRKLCWKTAAPFTVWTMMLWKTIWRTAAGMWILDAPSTPFLFFTLLNSALWESQSGWSWLLLLSRPLYRYSAIRCTSAVPMSPLELQQAQEVHRAPILEPEPKRSLNGEANAASKPSTKPQKGIMGMFANKTAPKTQDSHRDMKSEQQDASVVRVCIPASDHCCLQRKTKLFLSYWPVWSFQVDPPKSKPAKKVNPVVNFFGTQTTSKW